MTVREMLHDWQSGHGVVMDEGISYNATCDGKNHYLYKINKKALTLKRVCLTRKDVSMQEDLTVKNPPLTVTSGSLNMPAVMEGLAQVMDGLRR